MSKEINNIDELFRGKLRDYSVEAPEHLWKGIEASRTPLHRAINYFKGKKGAAFGTLVVLATLAGIAYFTSDSNNQIASNSAKAYSIQQYNNSASIQAATLDDASAIQLVNNTSTESSLNTTTNSNYSTPSNYSASTIPNNGDDNETAKDEPVATTQPSAEKELPAKPKQSAAKGNNAEKLADDINSSPSSKDTKQTNNNTQPVPTETTDNNEETPTIDETIIASDEATKGDGTEKSEKTKGQSGTTVEPPKNFSKFSADFYAGGNYTMRSLNNNGVNQDYFAAKKDAESYLPGFTIGARVSYDIKSFARLRAGIQYSRLGQRINLDREYKYTTTETVTGVILDPVTQQPIGTTTRTETVEHTETAKANTTNTISFVDIPLQLEFDFYSTKNLSVFASAGGAVNLLFTQSGYQINQRITGLNEISSANNPFRTTAGVSLLAGAGVNYKLTPRYSLLFEANYQHGLNNVMKDNAGMSQNYRIISGTVGLRYRF